MSLFILFLSHVLIAVGAVILMTMLCTGQPRDRRLILGTGNILFLSPKRPDRLWGTPDILFHWYRGITFEV